MASGLKQPITQVRLTNVAIVRLKLKGHRFEIACFKNKIKDYRNGIEKDLDEVMQTRQIFTNVSKGVTANKQDLRTVFGTDDIDVVSKLILDTGEIQVSEKERQLEQEQQWKSIATLVADKTVNSDTQRPFSVAMVESSMREAHVSVVPKRSAKQQALEVIRTLRSTVLPTMQRAQMRIHLNMPSAAGKIVKGKITSLVAHTESEEFTYDYDSTLLIDPGAFRAIEEIVSREGKGRGRIDILDHKVVADAHELLTEAELQALDNAADNAATSTSASAQSSTKTNTDAITDLPITTLDMERNGDHYDTKAAPNKSTKAGDSKADKKKSRKSKSAVTSDSDSDVADVTADISTIGMAHKSLAPTRKQLKKMAKKKAQATSDEEEEAPPARPVKAKTSKKKQPVAVSSSSSSSAEDSDETSSSDDEPAPEKKVSKAEKAKPAQTHSSSSDDDSDDESASKAKTSKRRTKR